MSYDEDKRKYIDYVNYIIMKQQKDRHGQPYQIIYYQILMNDFVHMYIILISIIQSITKCVCVTKLPEGFHGGRWLLLTHAIGRLAT